MEDAGCRKPKKTSKVMLMGASGAGWWLVAGGAVLDKKSREVQFVNQYFVHTYCTIIYQLLPPVPELIRISRILFGICAFKQF